MPNEQHFSLERLVLEEQNIEFVFMALLPKESGCNKCSHGFTLKFPFNVAQQELGHTN